MFDFTQANILIVGDIMLDRYYAGDTQRISPEAPVPVVKVREVKEQPGGAGNVALNVRALGAGASLITLVGADHPAEVLESELKAVDVNTHLLKQKQTTTTVKERILSQHQQLLRIDFEQDIPAHPSDALLTAFSEHLEHANAVILSDYAKGVLQKHSADFIKLARKAKVPVFVDPKGHDFSFYHGATLLTPNFKEFEAVVGPCETEREVLERGRRLMKQCDIEALLITRGEHGMTLLMRDEPEIYLPARGREVFDVTGAGDTVISVIATAFANGMSLPKAVELGNTAAGIVIGKLGAASVTPHELEQVMAGQSAYRSGVMDEDKCLMAVKEARARGERIVFTNGCFDVLHALHVEYLALSKQLGDRLIVAVNDDASITRLKGPGRPVNAAEHRMSVLAGLASVDWVIPFADDTPNRLLELIQPDVLAKGGDYSIDEVVGADIVQAYGGQVVVLGDTIKGVKSTSIIERIKELVRNDED